MQRAAFGSSSHEFWCDHNLRCAKTSNTTLSPNEQTCDTKKKFQLQLQPAAWQATMLLQVEAAWWKKESEEEMRQSTQMVVGVEAVVGIAEEGRQGQEVEVEAEAEVAG